MTEQNPHYPSQHYPPEHYPPEHHPQGVFQTPPRPPAKEKSGMGLLIAMGVGLFLLISGCVALLGGGGTEPTGGSQESQTPSVVATTESTTPSPEKTTGKATPKPTKAQSSLTNSQKQAIGMAEGYLAYSAFSRKGLIDQLQYEGFSKTDATFAVDHLKPNWNEQAARMAKDYLSYTNFSRKGLIEQLEYEGFTSKQAEYGATKAGL